jgi:plastocyanin
LSLQATNANTATLQGSSASRDGQRRYGFEFTIPITLSRYLPHRKSAQRRADVGTLVAVDSDVVASTGDSAAAVASAPTAPSASVDTVRRSAGDSAVRRALADSTRAAVTPNPVGAPNAPPHVARTVPSLPGRGTVAHASMREMNFRPLRIQVAAGATVAWTNSDAMIHTVTSDDGRWSSGAIEPGATWRRRFDRPGTYAFHCTPHPFMKGVVVVR